MVLVSCSTTKKPDIDATNLEALQNVSYEPSSFLAPKELSELRVKALEDTAMSLGAQGGLAYATEEMNTRLQRDRSYLETIYNFNGMMLSHGVIPPVLAEGDNSLNLDDPNTIRVADRTYKIIAQARFATTAPNWRDYLIMTYTKPEFPNKAFLPRTNQEKRIWRNAIKTGWDKGIQQAYSIFHQNLARLKRDYSGMILYRKLLQENMISPPFVAKTNLGVTGDGNEMRVNDQVLRISELPKLQADTQYWRPIVVKQHDNG